MSMRIPCCAMEIVTTDLTAKRASFVFILLAFCNLVIFGCATKTDAPEHTASIQQALKPSMTQKAQSPVSPGQNIQELSVREEQGQTILLLKFVQPVTQFRHFPLPQPSRIR